MLFRSWAAAKATTEIYTLSLHDALQIPIVSLYYANKEGKRYRSLGCAPCTSMVDSKASNIPEIIEELRNTKVAERSTRAQDAESEHAFEQLRAQGYM